MKDANLFQTPDKPEFFIDEDDTVQKYLPRDVKLTLPGYHIRHFKAGVQLVPRVLAEDPWLKANGMTDIPQSGPLPPMMRTAPVGSHAYAKSFMGGTGTYDASLIQDPRVTDEQLKQSQEIAAMAAANVSVAQEALQTAIAIKDNADRAVQASVDRIAQQVAEPRPLGENSDVSVADEKASAAARETEQKRRDRIISKMKPEDKAAFDGMSAEDQTAWLAAQK